MREIQHHFNRGERIELTQEKKDRQEEKFIGKVHLKSGCSLWAYDSDSDTMTVVKINGKASINMSGEIHTESRAMYNPKHLYFQAINERSARRKLKQYRDGNWSVVEDFSPKDFLKMDFFG